MEPIAQSVEPIARTLTVSEVQYPRRPPLRVHPRGASSHFVGSTIVILSSYAVTTMAMNCGKKMQETKNKSDGN